jgi:hypothetical protein
MIWIYVDSVAKIDYLFVSRDRFKSFNPELKATRLSEG